MKSYRNGARLKIRPKPMKSHQISARLKIMPKSMKTPQSRAQLKIMPKSKKSLQERRPTRLGRFSHTLPQTSQQARQERKWKIVVVARTTSNEPAGSMGKEIENSHTCNQTY